MNDEVTVTTIGAHLQYIPVLMTCGHFEVRLTRWNCFDPSTMSDPVNRQGFLQAGSVCTYCNAMGRPLTTNYETLALAQRAAEIKNEVRNA
jgi:hypothetical protein